MKINIKEQSLVAGFSAKIMRAGSIAIVFGKTIHLWNTSKKDFLQNKQWLRHELVHIEQFKKYGFVKFIFLYSWESAKKGYYKNKFEVEARSKENDTNLETGLFLPD